MTNTGSDLIIRHRIAKARNTLNEITNLLQFGYYSNAVSRIYYSCYYAVTALLLKENIKTKTHAGVRNMFSEHFVKTGLIPPHFSTFYSRVFEERQAGDYEDFTEFDKETIEMLYLSAKELVNMIEEFLAKK